MIETVDLMRYKYLLKYNILNEFPTLFCGPTGTGKSVYIKNLLMSFHRDKYQTVEIGFSAQTSSNQTLEIIDSKVDRRKKGIFGPK